MKAGAVVWEVLRTVLVVVLFRQVVFRHFVSAHFALVRVRSVFHSAHDPRAEELLETETPPKSPPPAPAFAARAADFRAEPLDRIFLGSVSSTKNQEKIG